MNASFLGGGMGRRQQGIKKKRKSKKLSWEKTCKSGRERDLEFALRELSV